MTEEGGDSNDIRSTYDEIDEEDEFFSSVLTNAAAIQATRHARRIYFGELSPTANEQSVATYFSHVMSAIGGNTAGPGDAVVNVYINHEKKFAFVEMRYVEEANNAMALDGIIFEEHEFGVVRGLPYYSTEAQVRELLESFVDLRGFDLVKDRETGNSKGYAFCVYQDLSVINITCAATNGIKMGDRTLTVRRANQGNLIQATALQTLTGVIRDSNAERSQRTENCIYEACFSICSKSNLCGLLQECIIMDAFPTEAETSGGHLSVLFYFSVD
ncbi:splicing factor U2af large subunit B-like protein isoform X3 [Tanacetum coccineum]